jgi:hypothetical protein
MSSVLAVALGYYEPGYLKQTTDSLNVCQIDYVVQMRDNQGVGSMAASFNRAMWRFTAPLDIDYVWMLTNVGFPNKMLMHMVGVLESHPKCAAVHPMFESDHPHLNCKRLGDKDCPEHGSTVPFVEWTAPMIRMSAWSEIGPLDENMPYWGFDLDWSRRALDAGWNLRVNTKSQLHHEYLRGRRKGEHRITTERRRKRAELDKATDAALCEKWGDDWLCKLWPTHPKVAKGVKCLYE